MSPKSTSSVQPRNCIHSKKKVSDLFFISIEQDCEKDLKRTERIMKLKWGDSQNIMFKDGIELNCLKGNYNQIVERYVDVFNMFGFFIFYIVACPLSPLIIIFWNLTILKVDVYLFARIFKKKILENAVDIGPWMRIFEFFMILAVINIIVFKFGI